MSPRSDPPPPTTLGDADALGRFARRQSRLSVVNRFDPVGVLFTCIFLCVAAVIAITVFYSSKLSTLFQPPTLVAAADRRIVGNFEKTPGCFGSAAQSVEGDRLLVTRRPGKSCGESAAAATVHGFTPNTRTWHTEQQPFAGDLGATAANGLSRACAGGCTTSDPVFARGDDGGIAAMSGGRWGTWLSQRRFIRPDTGTPISGPMVAAASGAPDNRRFALATTDGWVAIGEAVSGAWGPAVMGIEPPDPKVSVVQMRWVGRHLWLGTTGGLYVAEPSTGSTDEPRFRRVADEPVVDMDGAGDVVFVLSKLPCRRDARAECSRITSYEGPAQATRLLDELDRDPQLSPSDVTAIAAIGNEVVLAGRRGAMAYAVAGRRWRTLTEREVLLAEPAANGAIWLGGSQWVGVLDKPGQKLREFALPAATVQDRVSAITFTDAGDAVVSTAGRAVYRIGERSADLLWRATGTALTEPLVQVFADNRRLLAVTARSAQLFDLATRHYRLVPLEGPLAALPSTRLQTRSGRTQFAYVAEGSPRVLVFSLEAPADVRAIDVPRLAALGPWQAASGSDEALGVTTDGNLVRLSIDGAAPLGSRLADLALDMQRIRDATAVGTDRLVLAAPEGLALYDVRRRNWLTLDRNAYAAVESVPGTESLLAARGDGTLHRIDLGSAVASVPLTGGGVTFDADRVHDARFIGGVMFLAGAKQDRALLLAYDPVARRVVRPPLDLGPLQGEIRIMDMLPGQSPAQAWPLVRHGPAVRNGQTVLPAARDAKLLDAWTTERGPLALETGAKGETYLRTMGTGTDSRCLFRVQTPPSGAQTETARIDLDWRFQLVGSPQGADLYDRATARWVDTGLRGAVAVIATTGGAIWRRTEGSGVRIGHVRWPAGGSSYDTCDAAALVDLTERAVPSQVAKAAALHVRNGRVTLLAETGALAAWDGVAAAVPTAPQPGAAPDPDKVLRVERIGQRLLFVDQTAIHVYNLVTHAWQRAPIGVSEAIRHAVVQPIRDGAAAEIMVLTAGNAHRLISVEFGPTLGVRSEAVTGPPSPPPWGNRQRTLLDAVDDGTGHMLWLFDDGLEALDSKTGRWLTNWSESALPSNRERRLVRLGGRTVLVDVAGRRLTFVSLDRGQLASRTDELGKFRDVLVTSDGGKLYVIGDDSVVRECDLHERQPLACRVDRSAAALRIPARHAPSDTGAATTSPAPQALPAPQAVRAFRFQIEGQRVFLATETGERLSWKTLSVMRLAEIPSKQALQPLDFGWFAWRRGEGVFVVRTVDGGEVRLLPAEVFGAVGPLSGSDIRAASFRPGGGVALATAGGIWTTTSTNLSITAPNLRFQPIRFEGAVPVATATGFVAGARHVSPAGQTLPMPAATEIRLGDGVLRSDPTKQGIATTEPVGVRGKLLDVTGFAWDRRRNVGVAGDDDVVTSDWGVHRPLDPPDALKRLGEGGVVWSADAFKAVPSGASRPAQSIAAAMDADRVMTAVVAGDRLLVSTLAGVFQITPLADQPLERKPVDKAPVERFVLIGQAGNREIYGLRSGRSYLLGTTGFSAANFDPTASRDIARIGPLVARRNAEGVVMVLEATSGGTNQVTARKVSWEGGVFDFDTVRRVRSGTGGTLVETRSGALAVFEGARLPPLGEASFQFPSGAVANSEFGRAQPTGAAVAQTAGFCVTATASRLVACSAPLALAPARASAGSVAITIGEKPGAAAITIGPAKVPAALTSGKFSFDDVRMATGCSGTFAFVQGNGGLMLSSTAEASLADQVPIPVERGRGVAELHCIDADTAASLAVPPGLYGRTDGSSSAVSGQWLALTRQPHDAVAPMPEVVSALDTWRRQRIVLQAGDVRIGRGSDALITEVRRNGEWRPIPHVGSVPLTDQASVAWAAGSRIWTASGAGIALLDRRGASAYPSLDAVQPAAVAGCRYLRARGGGNGGAIVDCGGKTFSFANDGTATSVNTDAWSQEVTTSTLQVSLAGGAGPPAFRLGGRAASLAGGRFGFDSVSGLAYHAAENRLHHGSKDGWISISTARNATGQRPAHQPERPRAPDDLDIASVTAVTRDTSGVCLVAGNRQRRLATSGNLTAGPCRQDLGHAGFRGFVRDNGAVRFELNIDSRLPIGDQLRDGAFESDRAVGSMLKRTDKTFCTATRMPLVAMTGDDSGRRRLEAVAACPGAGATPPSQVLQRDCEVRIRPSTAQARCPHLPSGDWITFGVREKRCIELEQSKPLMIEVACRSGVTAAAAQIKLHRSSNELLFLKEDQLWISRHY